MSFESGEARGSTPAEAEAGAGSPRRHASWLRQPWRRALVFAAVLVALDQALQHFVLADGYLQSRRIAPFDPPIFCPEQAASLERIRVQVATGHAPLADFDFDRELGWQPPQDGVRGEFRFDWAGARIGSKALARERKPGTRRVVAVGDSFTFGAEVGAQETWIARIDAAHANLEIANLGLSGYGADQALLRLERDGLALHPDEVWFAVVPCNVLRCVTTYLPAWRHWSPMLAFKPRFTLDDRSELSLLRNPVSSFADLVATLEDQARFLERTAQSDFWVGAHPAAYGPRSSSLFDRSGLARILITLAERGGRDPVPYLLDRESVVFRLVVAITLRAQRSSATAGARFRFLLLPDQGGLQDLERRGVAYWQPLLVELEQRGVEVIDLSAELRAHHGATDAALWAPEGHYSPAGNRIVADALDARLLQAH